MHAHVLTSSIRPNLNDAKDKKIWCQPLFMHIAIEHESLLKQLV